MAQNILHKFHKDMPSAEEREGTQRDSETNVIYIK
jgi:hypothetical protein